LKFAHILFPVDFSARCHAAAGFVLSMAQHFGSRVTLLNVIPAAIFPVDFNYVDAETNASHRLEQFSRDEFPRMKAHCAVEIGDVAGEISAYGESSGADLIAMPSHGYGTFRRMLLGSITAKVLHDAKIPVWTAPHAPELSHRPLVQPKRILVAGGARIFDAAAALADKTGADLDVLPLDAELRQVALEKHADLVVTARSKAYDIVRDAPCPVLSLQLTEATECAGIREAHSPLDKPERSVA
jgi:nucleotide-binding universal stress UspA family protein